MVLRDLVKKLTSAAARGHAVTVCRVKRRQVEKLYKYGEVLREVGVQVGRSKQLEYLEIPNARDTTGVGTVRSGQ